MTRRRLERRLRRDLDAVTATVAPERSWDDLVARMEAGFTHHPEEDIIVIDTPVLEPDTVERSPKRRAVVGIAAAVIVLAAIWFASLVVANDDAVPVSRPETPLAIANALLDAAEDGDTERFMGFFADDAIIVNSAFFNDVPLGNLSGPGIREAFEGSVDAAGVGWTQEPPIDRECELRDDEVICTVTFEAAISGATSFDRIFLTIDDGLITSYRHRITDGDPEATQAFFTWAAEQEPSPEGQACVEIDFASTECGELWFDLIDQYLAEQSGE